MLYKIKIVIRVLSLLSILGLLIYIGWQPMFFGIGLALLMVIVIWAWDNDI